MNKPLLIIICDFLLISFISLIAKSLGNASPGEVRAEPAPAQEESVSGRDMLEVLEMALREKQEEQASLARELIDYKEQLTDTQSLLRVRENDLEATQNDLTSMQENLESMQGDLDAAQTDLEGKEAMVRRIEEERNRLESSYETTQQNLDSVQEEYQKVMSEAEQLEENLASTSQEALISQTRLETMTQELNVRRKEAEQTQEQMARLEEERRALEEEKHQLALDLRQSRTEAVLAKEHVAIARADVESAREDVVWARNEVLEMRNEVKIERTEKQAIIEKSELLATQVAELAEKSEEFKEEIRTNRPSSANSIFVDVQNNQLDTRFTAVKSGLFGERSVPRQSRSVVATNGRDHFLLYHISDTPLSLESSETPMRLTGEVRRGEAAYSIVEMGPIALDPRILAVPVDQAVVQSLGCKVYSLAADPYKFEEAVLVTARNSNFDEVSFKIDPDHPGYVKMNRPTFGKILGQFTPSRGDLVFSMTGELLGMMANNKYCAVFGEVSLGEMRIGFGDRYSEDATSRVLSLLHNRLEALSFSLQ